MYVLFLQICVDLNECLLDPDVCNGGVCINTEGGFTCRCPKGERERERGTRGDEEDVKKLTKIFRDSNQINSPF